MQVLYTILYILLFIFCLSVLVLIHEFGHFSVAKFFKVYIKEFSIGFGPKLLQKKRKNGETVFSLRAIPFGGYVSMYGEGVEADPTLNIDESRSYSSLKRWKKILILFAGVFNNAVLAIILFFISNSCFMQEEMYLRYVDVTNGSIAAVAGLRSGDYVVAREVKVLNNNEPVIAKGYYYLDSEALITYNDDTTTKCFAVLNSNDATFSSRSYDTSLHFFAKNNEGYTNLGNEFTASTQNIKNVSFTVNSATPAFKQFKDNAWSVLPESPITNPQVGEAYYDATNHKVMKWDSNNWVEAEVSNYTYVAPENPNSFDLWCDTEANKTPHELTLGINVDSEGKKSFVSSGLHYSYNSYWNNAGQMFGNTFKDFGNSATIIFRTLGSLFTSTDTWKEVGGVIAIGVQTTNILQNFGLAKFIYVWGLISVNLAIVNLMPFPGLDGWQILVLAVEGIFHKEIPEKVKNIVSFVGIALLFALMILIVIKDIIGLF